MARVNLRKAILAAGCVAGITTFCILRFQGTTPTSTEPPHEPARASYRLPLARRRTRPVARNALHSNRRDGAAQLAPSPRRAQSASTRVRVSGSVSIRSGQFREKPSSGNFRVASRPIFEPYVNVRLE